MADSTLSAIRTKVRRLTRSLSEAQLSTAQLDEYINTFVLYDFPEHLRTFNLRVTYSFYTNPGQDEYPTDTLSFAGAVNNALYNFQNRYLTIHAPIYISGYQAFFSQSREQFYGIYPIINSVAQTGLTGDGLTQIFSGVVNTTQANPGPAQQINQGLLQRNVLFTSIGTNGVGLAMADVPVVDPTSGYKTQEGNLYDVNSAAYQAALVTPPTVVDATNTINYLSGAFTVTFSAPPDSGIPINSQTVPVVLTLPQALLYYGNTFIVRPVPDQSYKVNFECYIRPTELLTANQSPNLEEWWQYIAYGASKKIFEDKMDLESVQMIMPEFKQQERLCLRRTLVQYTNERTATIYTEQTQTSGGYGPGWLGGGGSF